MTHHDDGDPSRPAHRVSVRLQRVQQIHSRWRGGIAQRGGRRGMGACSRRCAARGDGSVAEQRRPVQPDPGGARPRRHAPLSPGASTLFYVGGCSPMLPQLPSPGGWLLELKILVGLGSQTWRRAGLNHRLASCSLVRARFRRPSPSAGRHARPDASRRTTVRGGSRGTPSWTSWRADARCRRRGHTPPCPATGHRW